MGSDDGRKLAPHSVSADDCAGPLKDSEEAMVPRAVVPHILLEHLLNKRQLAVPQLRTVEVREHPLPVAPCVVVLVVGLEHFGDKG